MSSPPTDMPCISRTMHSMMGAITPAWLYVGKHPMSTVATHMSSTDSSCQHICHIIVRCMNRECEIRCVMLMWCGTNACLFRQCINTKIALQAMIVHNSSSMAKSTPVVKTTSNAWQETSNFRTCSESVNSQALVSVRSHHQFAQTGWHRRAS